MHTSEQILKMDDLYDLQDAFGSSGIPFKYELTDAEIGWLNHIRGKYSIADYIDERLEGNILTFTDPTTLTEVLEGDGIENKAVMLSNDTALQKIFFWVS